MRSVSRKIVKNEVSDPKDRNTKREAILKAALDLVVEGGFHSAPMSAISKRAMASAGVIYHHFASKEEIFQTVYERTCHLKRGSLLNGYTDAIEAREAFILVALNAYTFYRQFQKELRYLSLFEDAGFAIPESTRTPTPEVIQFQQRFSGRTQGGVFADLPPHVIDEMSLGLIARLARNPKKLSPAMLRQISERIWDALKA